VQPFIGFMVQHYSGVLTEENCYYPFGLVQQGINSKAAGRLENKIKYNGIELEKALDLNVYDAQFRELDPQVGRWWQIDPKTDEMYMWSTYASNFDNPIRFEDPLGDMPGSCCPGAANLWQWFTQTAASNGPIAGKPILVVGGIAVTGYALWEAVKPSDAEIAATNAAWLKADAQMSGIGGTYTMGTTTTAGKSYAKPGQVAVPALTTGAAAGIKNLVVQMKGAVSSTSNTGNLNPTNGNGGNQIAGRGKSANKLQPDKSAQGDHSTFKRDANGNIYKYQQWKKNDKNPNGFDRGKRFDGGKPDGTPGAPHNGIPTPHINEKKDSRTPATYEFPQNQRFSFFPTGT
jgi:RHS repeat-associated protein